MIDARIVIVGAGLAGASTAYHLHQLGERSIILLERERVAGVHASGRNAALVRSRLGDAALQ
ncbi:MAG: FAD-dependent oxidoreductase, partial [Candidatus Eiseniibacteriota bacterium]